MVVVTTMVLVMVTIVKEVRFVMVGGGWSLCGGWYLAFPRLFVSEAG